MSPRLRVSRRPPPVPSRLRDALYAGRLFQPSGSALAEYARP